MQDALEQGDPSGYLALVAEEGDREEAEAFAGFQFEPGASRVVVQERDRQAVADETGTFTRLILEIFQERGRIGRISTWRLNVSPPPGPGLAGEEPWRIVSQEILTTLDGLYRLSLDSSRQFSASNLIVSAEDLTLTLASGVVFVAEVPGGPTALVLRGRGRMAFAPKPAAERGQLRIFARDETLETDFDQAFIRLPPGDLEQRVTTAALTPGPVDRRELQRAESLFTDRVDLSYALDLGDLSPHLWSLLPSGGDFLADIDTRRHGILTYARSGRDPEDITLFDRKKRKTISVYPSEARRATRTSYNEDELSDIDVTDYVVDTIYEPDRLWIDGRTRLRVKVKAYALASLTLKLAEELTIRSVFSDRFGRLMHLRVRGQDSVLIGLPEVISRDETLLLSLTYSGPLPPQPLDREAIAQDRQNAIVYTQDEEFFRPEQRFIYSSRSHWYPHGPSSNYATATVRITVPERYSAIASGDPDPGSPVEVGDGQLQFVYHARRPIRYLAFVASRFRRIQSTAITLPQPLSPGAPDATLVIPPSPSAIPEPVTLVVEANPRYEGRARNLVGTLDDVMVFYGALLGDVPYPSFTLVLSESDLPGGHSPAYFAILNQPVPTSPYVWHNDPASFSGFSDFYLAHEVAHQWWGQAVGWQNYHEQWLSEGLSQYFAVLFADYTGGSQRFREALKHMRRWAIDRAEQGPISLGYRLGHLQSDSRDFRALVYNKGAMTLHMLRRLVGDEAFIGGIRTFYQASRFRKVGTDDLRRAFEQVAGRSFDRFFERWIYEAAVPTVRFSSRVVDAEAGEDGGTPTRVLLLRFEQRNAEPFELPVTVTVGYAGGRTEEVLVHLDEAVVEHRVPLSGEMRSVEVNQDGGALAEFVR